MWLLRQLGFLRFGRSGEHDAAEHRVLHLFRNRAELKKSYMAVQDEIQTLKDRVKQQEGVTARVQEMLQDLEGRLAQVDSGYRSLVFYQLRELWAAGRTLLAQFADELRTQQEGRERQSFLAEHNRQHYLRLQAAAEQVRAAEDRVEAARLELAELEAAIAKLNRPWHYFRRLKLKRNRQPAHLAVLLAEQDAGTVREGCAAVDAEPAAEYPGLSLEARRAINIAVIAYASLLRDRLAGTRLFELALEASGRREPPEHYGSRVDCERMMVEIQRGRASLRQRSGLAQGLKDRAEALKKQARYRSGDDAIPAAGGDAQGAMTAIQEDAWELGRVLLS
jgi:hypothetical protein